MPKLINLHSDTTVIMFTIFVPMVGLVIVSNYAPQYTTSAAYVMLAVMFVPMIYMQANAYVLGTRFPHIEMSLFESTSGIALRVLDYFVDYFDPIRKIPDVYSVMQKKPYCARCKKWVKAPKCPECGTVTQKRDYPVYMWGRWWYPYIVYTKWGVSFLDYSDIKMHFFVLPEPFDTFVKFGKREEGAYLTGTNFTSGQSSHVDAILAPFAADYLGVKIPIYLCVFSRRSVEKITVDWAADMASFARYVKDMPRFLQQEEANLYPKKEMEDVMAGVFPELKSKLVQAKEEEPQ